MYARRGASNYRPRHRLQQPARLTRQTMLAAMSFGLLLIVPSAAAQLQLGLDEEQAALASSDVDDSAGESVVTAPLPTPLPVVPPQRVAPTKAASVTRVPAKTPVSAEDARVRPPLVAAYQLAVAVAPEKCDITPELLAAVAQVESGNLAGRRLDAENRAKPALIGRPLNGEGAALVPDTDAGELDGDRRYDRAVGPMGFLPSSWRVAGVDLDADGTRDPQDIDDAAGAAMVYLCSGGVDLGVPAQARKAIRTFNRSEGYVRQVLAWQRAFEEVGLAPRVPTSGPSAEPGSRDPRPGTGDQGGKGRDPRDPQRPEPLLGHEATLIPPRQPSPFVPTPPPDPTPTPTPTPDPTPDNPTGGTAGTGGTGGTGAPGEDCTTDPGDTTTPGPSPTAQPTAQPTTQPSPDTTGLEGETDCAAPPEEGRPAEGPAEGPTAGSTAG